MKFCFNSPNSEHGVDRMHLKCGVMLPDKRICVIGRGRTKGMVQQISLLLFFFQVGYEEESNKYTLSLQKIERGFPSIFPRQLDFLASVG